MAEALSQNQIDELLKKMQSGGVEEPTVNKEEDKVKEYDFTSPKKFTKDQLNSLNTLHENFGRVLSIYFTGIFRSVCETEVIGVEEQRYNEFNNVLPDLTLVAMISFEPIDDSYYGLTLLIEFPTSLGFLLIDRLMGGSGKVYSPERDYTEIERSLLEFVLNNVTKNLEDAWNNYFPCKLELQSIETNGRMLQAYSPQDIVAIVTMDVKEELHSGLINVCMSAGNIESILDSFSVKYAHVERQLDPAKEQNRKDTLLSYLKESDLNIEAILDVCQMNLSEVSSLQPGDIIALNKKVDSNVTVNVEGIPWCSARIGEINNNKALKLVEVFER